MLAKLMARFHKVGDPKHLKKDQSVSADENGAVLTRLVDGAGDALSLAGLALDASVLAGNVVLAAIRDRLPAALTGSGNLKTAIVEAVPAGTNNIGDVDVLTLPAIPAGTNTIGAVETIGFLKGSTAANKLTVEAIDTDRNAASVNLATGIAGEDLTNGAMGTVPKLIAANTYAPSLATNFGSVTKANAKASAGNALGFVATNANGSVRYFQIHNKATAPAAADVPLLSFAVPAGGALQVDLTVGSGIACSAGVGYAWSTTVGTLTDAATASEHTNAVFYK